MAKSKIKPAFPGRSSSLGYEPGLTKLEWIVTQLIAARITRGPMNMDTEDTIFVDMAKSIIKQCEDAESKDN